MVALAVWRLSKRGCPSMSSIICELQLGGPVIAFHVASSVSLDGFKLVNTCLSCRVTCSSSVIQE
ncbi:hypothetical protein DPMN_155428 [Dreissena polymorpha]|uniref:Uncharacterized protein n=1 Tax=Dreissena polymorpha TaxID=45954 RepID=A0A9D4FPF1_DREPO|nr:hypothetical protein DPMN_155428 [Dreissena polymorpha]